MEQARWGAAPLVLQGRPMVFLDIGVGHRCGHRWTYRLLIPSKPVSALPFRPTDRSRAAEDRSAGGVRDRTGPEPLMLVRSGSATDG
jgi:hypothetical protein